MMRAFHNVIPAEKPGLARADPIGLRGPKTQTRAFYAFGSFSVPPNAQAELGIFRNEKRPKPLQGKGLRFLK